MNKSTDTIKRLPWCVLLWPMLATDVGTLPEKMHWANLSPYIQSGFRSGPDAKNWANAEGCFDVHLWGK